jgi:hypothetical protein
MLPPGEPGVRGRPSGTPLDDLRTIAAAGCPRRRRPDRTAAKPYVGGGPLLDEPLLLDEVAERLA